ncbi:MAG: acetylornithine deacetylase [Gammaproteobacteria bacterium]|nr:acetylornithine deacetylase [Gammaproteobacteria bacterium]MCW8839769.1 acetylornithine deacetylase [Gammaproteobacteria bacterium]MCW8958841.1 acetylornithine deacetylase [Gammaproteobacteria bacterium]MCW8971676.1 acetylornithine deacetylase [Gammaproteobacteria bacterium]MCW8993419.1 acetylornithine deacetylase [Gammaproteobacteria bacterium]
MTRHTLPSLRAMLGALIAAPSMSSVSPEFDSSNREVIELLAGWLEPLGFHIEIVPLPSQPHKANLIATLGQGSGGLVLAGHTDTVPYDEGRWNFDPFHLTEKHNRLYGLGTCDMKGFFALAIEAARSFDKGQLQQPLIILATADEESSMEGAQALVELGRPRARYAVIGEPTGLRPVNAHKGIMMEAVRLTGRSGHSSDPSLGVSALEGMHKVIGDLLAWREQLQATHHAPQFKVPVPTLNLGHIHGGDNPNRICGHCELHFDLRPIPGMELEALRETLNDRLHRLLGESELGWELAPLFHGTAAMHTPTTSAIVEAAEALTGHDSEAVAFCTEGPYLTEMGIETLILGPGDIAQAHQPDEYLAMDRLNPTVELLKQLITRFCL